MNKEYQIFEVLQNDINASINESLGISDAVSSETNRECDIPKKQFSNMPLNATVKNNLYNQNYYSRLIANILYLIDKHEISGFMQGFYEFINKEKWNYGSVDAAVEHSESYNLMMSLKEKIIEAEELMTDDKFIEGIDAYKNYGINHNNFLKIANGRYHEIISRIGKAIVKAKQDFLKEGLRVDFGDYFHFHGSFFRKK